MAKAKLDLFPLGVATGPAHCNRTEEREQLKHNILELTHTWLWARRRMGKTSLIAQVLQDLSRAKRKIVALTIDLLVVHDAEALENRIREGVQRLGIEILPKGQKATAKLSKAFARLNPKFSVGLAGVNLELEKQSSMVGIAELLMGLDVAAGLYRRRVVIVLDEFQQLTQFKDTHIGQAAEGAIRHAVERSKNIAYLFSGSQKHLLSTMFEDEDRPLYRLCRKMSLQQIEPPAYRDFLREASMARWRRLMSDERIAQILSITTRHPYYVNALCTRLWELGRLPSEKDVLDAWATLVDEDRSFVSGKVLRLSATQRAMLKAIAGEEQGVEHPASNAFLAKIRLPSSTGNKAKEILEQNDFIQLNEHGRWVVVDPVMAAILRTL